MDLGLLKDEIGALIMTATIVDDLVNWSLFAIILGNIAPSSQTTTNLPLNVGLVIVFVVSSDIWSRRRARRRVSVAPGETSAQAEAEASA